MPLGTPFKNLLEAAGGMRDNRSCKAVIPGGSSMYLLKGQTMLETNMDYESVKKAGSSIGSGGVIVMDDTTCMVEALESVMYFYRHESCGQCTPCREGSGWLHDMIKSILEGQAKIGDLEKIMEVASNMEGRTICVFAEAMSWPINSFIRLFYDEFDHYIRHGFSLVKGSQK